MVKTNNNGNKFWLKFLVGIGIVLLGVAVGYGVLNERVAHNCEDIKEIKPKVDILQKSSIEQGADIKHIKETVDRIEKKL